jgi:magnesium transporter
MLTIYDSAAGRLTKRDSAAIWSAPTEPVWIDLVSPSRQEDADVEKLTGVQIPTRDEMEEIEASSRIYQEHGAHYMTAIVLHQEDAPQVPTVTSRRFLEAPDTMMSPVPTAEAITFVLSKNSLITVRYQEPRAFPLFLARNQKGDNPVKCAASTMVGLLEAIIDREADRVERVQAEVDKIGHRIFEIRGGQASMNRRYDLAVKQIGREGELTGRSRESLQSLGRVLSYLAMVLTERNEEKSLLARVSTASRDVDGLNNQVEYLSGKVAFLLDATLGMISLQQNNIIKFFTVVSVAMMPPTLLASIYGMNFKHMPELEWSFGYPLAISIMVVSAVLPFWYFRRRGWL